MLLPRKRTKIVCTIGPASEKVSTLTKMIRAGMNVARLNFSHGTYTHHRMLARNIRVAARRADAPVAIIADLPGPKVRVGELPGTGVRMRKGETVIFVVGSERTDGSAIPVPYAGLARDLSRGDRILLDDGLIEVRVTDVRGRRIQTQVVVGGVLTSHKGFNVPTATLHLPAVTKKDLRDLHFALTQDIDFVALSFVRRAADIAPVRRRLDRSLKYRDIGIIAKIEKHEAVKNFSEILRAADGIMVARGDLGIEVPAEEVPVIQKEIIGQCLAASKPVIVATQMLDSMIRNPRPTRAEVSDVANAVVDHADAVMLAGESAIGKYPIRTVRMMARIAEETEASRFDDLSPEDWDRAASSVGQAIGEAAGVLASCPRLRGIIVTTMTGASAREVARFRPELPLLACSPDPRIVRQLSLLWGAIPRRLKREKSMVALSRQARRAALRSKIFKKGDEVLFVTGSPVARSGTINKVEIICL